MTTFALVHGAWHSGGCWEPTAALLRDAGHDVVTPDLPCEDASAGLEAYAATVLDALVDLPSDDLVVVGHSLGGLTIPLIAAARPVRELVFLCALVPLPGASVAEDLMVLGDTFAPEWPVLAAHQVAHDGGSSSWPTDAAIDAFYHDCPPDLAASAAAMLRRQTWTPSTDKSPLVAYPDAPARAIVCTEDRVLLAESCARHASERLDATVIRLAGGHSPMLAQPAALVEALTRAV
ncbi:MAG: alpha/beta hydrolase [Acidimicrobiales bacterium]